MITLIGTGHVFNLAAALTTVLDQKHPDVICVELDPQRYHALMQRQTNPTTSQHTSRNLPLIYRLLARFQQSMAQQYGVNPGDEMLTASSYAQSHNLPLKLIDMNAQKLFITMWHSMSFAEKIKLIFSGFSGFFVSKKHVEEELNNFQNNFEEYIDKIGSQFPTIKKLLIDQRNDYMAQQLLTLTPSYETIIACLGDGHLTGISKILTEKTINHEIIRLKDLQNITPPETTGVEAHFTINYQPPTQ
jgi:pheromone shutdown-related protein TraB